MDYEQELKVMFWKGAATGISFRCFLCIMYT